MVNIDASTPQLRVVKKWFEAYASLDVDKPEPLLSKDYKQQTLPKSIGLPDETKEEHLKRFRGMSPSITKLEVRIQYRGATFKLTNSYPPLGHYSRSD